MNGDEMKELNAAVRNEWFKTASLSEKQRETTIAHFMTVVDNIRRAKGHEYAVDGDPNGNFKRVAARTGQSVYQVWMAHFTKHLDAIENFVKNPDMVMAEPIDGRIADAINYMQILHTLVDEERRARVTRGPDRSSADRGDDRTTSDAGQAIPDQAPSDVGD